jgi:hypothetical protein
MSATVLVEIATVLVESRAVAVGVFSGGDPEARAVAVHISDTTDTRGEHTYPCPWRLP